MGYILMFLIHCIMFIGVVITTLFLNQYSFILAICFDILYLITINLFTEELKQN